MQDLAQALRFVKGAVAAKDFVPEFTHFRIKDGRVIAFNGRLSLSHPIDLDFDVSPKAKFFEKALASMPEDAPVSITVTQAGRLSVKAGSFRVLVHCHMDIPDHLFPQPEGDIHPIDLDLLGIFKDVYPFIAEDASRPWAQSVLLKDRSAYATNNSALVERWCGTMFPSALAIPVDAVREILRIGVEPCSLQIGLRSATFHFPNGAWLRTQFREQDWPDLAPVIDQPRTGLQPVPQAFFENVKRLETFIEDSGSIYIKGTTLSTTTTDSEGATLEVEQPLGDAAFHIKVLLKIAAVATHIDFRNRPAVFVAPGIRGVAMPMTA